jgi:hypothetical protein
MVNQRFSGQYVDQRGFLVPKFELHQLRGLFGFVSFATGLADVPADQHDGSDERYGSDPDPIYAEHMVAPV